MGKNGNGGGSSLGKVALAFLVIILLLGVLWYSGIVEFQVEQPSQPTVPSQPSVYTGLLDVKQKCFDSFDVATSYTHGTHYNCYWFVNRGGWIQLGSGDLTIEVTPDDYGYIYAMVSIPSGQNYYVDYKTIPQKNSRVKTVTYEDITGDGNKDFVFKIWVGDVPVPSSGNPTIYFYPYIAAYQKPSINSPSDISGIGTGAQTKFIEWYLSFANTKKAWIITKVEIKYNSTDETKIDLKNVNIPGIGYVSGSQFTMEETATHTKYTYTIGNDLSNGLWLRYGTNQLNKFPFDTKIVTHLASNDVLDLTITIYGLKPDGSLESVTDTVQLSEASS